jgi:hypothetical protein
MSSSATVTSPRNINTKPPLTVPRYLLSTSTLTPKHQHTTTLPDTLFPYTPLFLSLRRTCGTVRGGFVLMFRGEVTGAEEVTWNCEIGRAHV